MSRHKHTPAPWLRSAFCDSQGFKIKSKETDKLVAIVKVQQTQKPKEAVYNSCLIAAAPEMYDKLIEVGSWLRQIAHEDHNFTDDEIETTCDIYFQEILKLIAKASGEKNQ
jgi:hypothetical protein